MRCIVLLEVDDAETTEIAQNEFGENMVFDSYNEADDWCSRKAIGMWVKVVNLDDDDDE